MGLTFENFKGRIVTPESQSKLFELNPNRKAYTKKLHPDWDTMYMMVEDVLMNPYDVRDWLIQASLLVGTNDLIPDKTGAPGMQQPVANEWMKDYVMFLRQCLYHLNITHRQISWYDFNCYTNCFWRNMKSIDSNYRPHVDPGDFAFNLFLSDDLHEDDGTAMYAIKMPDGQRWMDCRKMEKISGIHPNTTSMRMDQGRIGEGLIDEWKYFKGDEIYDWIGVAPARFNSVSGYRGSIFHSAAYDPTNYDDDHVRYSLVTMLTLTAPVNGRSSFISGKTPERYGMPKGGKPAGTW